MWLEELVWLWGPLVGGAVLWGTWTLNALRTEVRTLRSRIEQLEARLELHEPARQKVA